jgi:hypothetical protein
MTTLTGTPQSGTPNRMSISPPGPKEKAAAQPANARQAQQSRSSFNEKLEEAERRTKENAGANKADAKKKADPAEETLTEAVFGSDKKSLDSNIFSLSPQGQIAAPAVGEVHAAQHSNEAQLAQIERMAAAIAEAVQKGNQTVFTVEFGSSASIAESAIVARDAMGMISINIIAPNSNIQSSAWQVLRNQLADKLRDRKVALKNVTVNRKSDAQA